MKEALLKYIKDNDIIQHGAYKLASGKESSFYIDGRKLTLHCAGLHLCATLLTDEFYKNIGGFQAVGGPSAGADPLITGIILTADTIGFMVRKEPKDYGTKQLIEGPVKPGMDVVIVEDTVTTGGSAIRAIKAARDFGLKVKAVGSVFFRGTDNPFDVPFFYLIKVDENGVIRG